MWVYIGRRLLWLPFLLFAVSMVTFTLGRFGPGDPVAVILGARYEEQTGERLRQSGGLNRPFFVQYGDYMWGAIGGDFGESIRYRGRSVSSLLKAKMWVSFQVSAAAMIVSVGLGLPLGFWVAHKQGRWQDPATVTVALVLMSVPIMVSIPFMLWLLCLKLDLLPCSGWGGFWDVRIIIPAITMGIPGVAGLARLMRASTLEIMGQDFIRTARAKGLSESKLDTTHSLKNAIVPIVTVLSLSLAGLLSTGIITERILGIPGVGNFAIEAIFNRDYPVIMAITLVGAFAFVIANLIADIVYTIIDPSIRYS